MSGASLDMEHGAEGMPAAGGAGDGGVAGIGGRWRHGGGRVGRTPEWTGRDLEQERFSRSGGRRSAVCKAVRDTRIPPDVKSKGGTVYRKFV